MKTVINFDEWAYRVGEEFDFIERAECCEGCDPNCPDRCILPFEAWNDERNPEIYYITIEDYRHQLLKDFISMAKFSGIEIEEAADQFGFIVIRDEKKIPKEVKRK